MGAHASALAATSTAPAGVVPGIATSNATATLRTGAGVDAGYATRIVCAAPRSAMGIVSTRDSSRHTQFSVAAPFTVTVVGWSTTPWTLTSIARGP